MCGIYASCTLLEDEHFGYDANSSVETADFRISENEAVRILRSAYPKLFGITTKSSCSEIEIKEIYPILNDMPATKSSGVVIGDTLLYVVNFKDEKGFAILSADKRVTPDILVLGSDGNIPSGWGTNTGDGSDTLQFVAMPNPYYDEEEDEYCVGSYESPERILTELTKEYAIAMMKESGSTETWKDHYISDPTGHGGYWCFPANVREDTLPVIEPLIYSKWHQNAPYNNKCPTYSKGRKPAGCVPIAVAAILAYNAYPREFSYKGVKIDWDLVSKDSVIYNNGSEQAEMVAALVAKVGDDCKTWYTRWFGMTWPIDVEKAMKSWGYDNVERIKRFDEDKVIRSLNERKPVFIAGTEKKNIFHGHAWVIDGYDKIEATYDLVNGKNKADTLSWGNKSIVSYLLWCKTGWGSISKVRVHSGIFKFPYNEEKTEYKRYERFFRMITYDVPK